MLKVENINVTFTSRGETTHAVKGISFEIKAGETVGIVGESGSGKTTAFQAITGLLPQGTISGSALFDGMDLKAALGKKIGMIFQSPMSSLNPTMRIGAQIAEGMIYHGFATKSWAKKRANELLKLVGIPEDRARQYPHEFSGGQRQRIAIAIALACNPRLLIADEPTTALDAIVQEQILHLIQEIQKKWGMSLILISHDLKLVGKICDRILVFYNGKIVEQGNAREILTRPNHPYTQVLLAAGSSIQVKKEIEYFSWIEMKNITKFYRKFKAVDDVTLSIRKGEILALVGESGSGKSTLGKILLGLISPDYGQITCDGKKKRFQMIFQDPYSTLNPRMCIKDILEEPTRIHGEKSRVDELLNLVSLNLKLKERYPHELSGGQRQRVGIARALALNPELLVCDEPVSSLDLTIQSQIIKLLLKLKVELHLTMLFISHDLPMVQKIADRIAVMKDGKILEINTMDQLQHPYSKELFTSCRKLPDKELFPKTSPIVG